MMRVCVATAGHLSTCPRMVKVADALHGAGYDVRVVSTRTTEWAAAGDLHLKASRGWSWRVVDLTRASGAAARRASGLRHRAARLVASRLDAGALPWRVVSSAFSRAGTELTRAIVAEGADIVFAGTSGALVAARESAAALGCGYGVDLEDLHTAEREDDGAALHHQLADRVLAEVLPDARLVTTGSCQLARCYHAAYGVEPQVVHNVWPLPAVPPTIQDPGGPLRFYWFSQTVGHGRGLEAAIQAIGAAGIDACLVLRGSLVPGYERSLRGLSQSVAPRLVLEVCPPVAPDDLAGSCGGFHVGLATEVGTVENRRVALSNKLFMYLSTGLAVLATSVPAQRAVLDPLGSHVAWLDPDAPEASASCLRRWSEDRAALAAARQAAWDAAVRRWHWDHPLERGRFLDAFARAFH